MTQQIRDTLLFEGKQYYLNSEILEGYFREFPELQPETDVVCTALWRGYIARFEIRDDQLFIADLEIMAYDDLSTKSVLDEICPNNKKFEWYSGLIRIDEFRGEFDNEPLEGLFEFLEIKNGNFVQKRIMNHAQLERFKQEQFDYFMISDDYTAVYELWKTNNEGIAVETINNSIREEILRYTREVYVDYIPYMDKKEAIEIAEKYIASYELNARIIEEHTLNYPSWIDGFRNVDDEVWVVQAENLNERKMEGSDQYSIVVSVVRQCVEDCILT